MKFYPFEVVKIKRVGGKQRGGGAQVGNATPDPAAPDPPVVFRFINYDQPCVCVRGCFFVLLLLLRRLLEPIIKLINYGCEWPTAKKLPIHFHLETVTNGR